MAGITRTRVSEVMCITVPPLGGEKITSKMFYRGKKRIKVKHNDLI